MLDYFLAVGSQCFFLPTRLKNLKCLLSGIRETIHSSSLTSLKELVNCELGGELWQGALFGNMLVFSDLCAQSLVGKAECNGKHPTVNLLIA